MEWKQEEPNWYIAKCADLMLDVELMETGGDPEPWLWTANLNRAESEGAIEFQSGWAASGDAAKLAAESFARTWVAAQAAALGDGGEWTSAIPKEPGWYWVRTAHDERRPGQLTPPRIELLKTNDLARYWGEPFQCWSVPVEPPPLPEPK